MKRPPFELAQEEPSANGTRCCPYCLRLLFWRYDRGPFNMLGEPLCLAHGNLRAWYVLRVFGRRLFIVAVGRRRRSGWALARPVRARKRPLHRRPTSRRRSQTGYEKHSIHRQLSLADLQALPLRGPDAHVTSRPS